MTTAERWFEEGQEELGLSRSADSRSDYQADLRRALGAFEKALAIDPAHLPSLLAKARTHAALGDHEAAADAWVAAAQHAPLDAALHLASGTSLLRLGQPEAALGHFEQALTLAPTDAEALFLRAQVLMALGRDEAALQAWEAVLAQPDGRPATVSGGRELLVSTSDTRRDEARFACALLRSRRQDPGAFSAYLQLFKTGGVRLTGMGAPQTLREALASDATCREAYFAFLDAAADVNAWKRAAHLFGDARRPDDTLTVTERLVALAPGDHFAWWLRAEAHAARGALLAALADYDQSLALNPTFLGAKARREVVRAQAVAEGLIPHP